MDDLAPPTTAYLLLAPLRARDERRVVPHDCLLHLGEDDPLPQDPSRAVTLPLGRWLIETEALTARGRAWPRLSGEDRLEALAPHLERVERVALLFPTFADGRAYSLARLLRERHGFAGELRAVGEVLRDQLFYMWRCGFNAFELAPGVDPEEALTAWQDFTVSYQPATDQEQPAWRRYDRRTIEISSVPKSAAE